MIRLNGKVKAPIQPRDRVQNPRTGRKGRVTKLISHDEASVLWDDGEEFAIRIVHLELIDYEPGNKRIV